VAKTNSERIALAMDNLQSGLHRYFKVQVQRDKGIAYEIQKLMDEDRNLVGPKKLEKIDVLALLKLMRKSWGEHFEPMLGKTCLLYVNELIEWRNQWAHQQKISDNDLIRLLDTSERLLDSLSSSDEAKRIGAIRRELINTRSNETVSKNVKKTLDLGNPKQLAPWRDVITPQNDVAKGNFVLSDFAADLGMVFKGESSQEYNDPEEFFTRTFFTDSLKSLLKNALKRTSGQHADSVINLQTNFGGGKTHSMLALYHLFSGEDLTAERPIKKLIDEANINQIPKVRKAVLVGTKISPSSPDPKPEGVEVHTLWGELAYQLGGLEAYNLIREDDLNATNPGDTLRKILNKYGPCLILIDEWVAYARQLPEDGPKISGGSFSTQFTFAQTLTEAVVSTSNCLLVLSLPASASDGAIQSQVEDIEVGGTRGRDALKRLGNVLTRIDSAWRPADKIESFQIVQRRLFQDIHSDKIGDKNVTIRTFSRFYGENPSEFPPECKDSDYKNLFELTYPFHPELFERLYSDWATIPNFQRTRGILRLMAEVVHCLWSNDDKNPIIMPSLIPLNDKRVSSEFNRYLEGNWNPILERDIDGERSLPKRIDDEVSTLGRCHATKRIARATFIGSAPTKISSQRGIEDIRVRLGCILPGESIQTFSDASRRLERKAHHLYREGTRTWYDTTPTVSRLAEDRAEEFRSKPREIKNTIYNRLNEQFQYRGIFRNGLHIFPDSTGEVFDTEDLSLIILPTEKKFSKNHPDDPAIKSTWEFLQNKGNTPRTYLNTMVFLAPQEKQLDYLENDVRLYLAWKSISDEKEILNLPPFQQKQVNKRMEDSLSSIKSKILDTFNILLVPEQLLPTDNVEISSKKISIYHGGKKIVEVIREALNKNDQLVSELFSPMLRKLMDDIPLWEGKDGSHLRVTQLREYFLKYLYLPRLEKDEVLFQSIRYGSEDTLLTWESETFAYADSFDEQTEKYSGLRTKNYGKTGLLVKPSVAIEHFKKAIDDNGNGEKDNGNGEKDNGNGEDDNGNGEDDNGIKPIKEKKYRKYKATTTLNPESPNPKFNDIANYILDPLLRDVANVQVKVEIVAIMPSEGEANNGFSDETIRTLNENSPLIDLDGEFLKD